MKKVKPVLEAIQNFGAALPTFVQQQRDVLTQTEHEMARVQMLLSEEEQRWKRQTQLMEEQLDQCKKTAQAVAAQGIRVDCSSLARQVEYAKSRLLKARQMQKRVQEAALQYQHTAHRYQNVITTDISRAKTCLNNEELALEAYLAAHVFARAVILSAEQPELKAVADKAIQYSQAKFKKYIGDLGENIAMETIRERFGLEEVPFDQPKHGFDRVFRSPSSPVILVESKINKDGEIHLRDTNRGQQMSTEWITDKSIRMTNPESAQWSPVNERIGKLIQELDPANIPAITVVTNPNTGQVDVYYRTNMSDWRLME